MSPTQQRYVDQHEAANLAGCSYDTIRRRRKGGAFPHARQRPGDRGGTWEIPLGDLAAAGLYDAAGSDDIETLDGPRRTRADHDRERTRAELLRAETTIKFLNARIAHQDAEVKFLRKLVADAVTGNNRRCA